MFVHEELCGNFNLTEEHPKQTIWEEKGIAAFGTVSVYQATGNSAVLVNVNDNFYLDVQHHQTKSVTLPRLQRIEVSGGKSTGKYCIQLHYVSPIPECSEEEE